MRSPWFYAPVTFYFPDRGEILGTIDDICWKTPFGWTWDVAISLLLGAIWEHAGGDFERFVRMLVRVWLHEYLHLLVGWERARTRTFRWKEGWENEQIVKKLENLLLGDE